MSKCLINRFLSLTLVVAGGILRAGSPAFAAEKLVGLQSAPSILYPKYDLDFQLVYIASSGIVTAAISGGNGSDCSSVQSLFRLLSRSRL